MKIGILTYHRTLNYGGCLQALATRLILEQLGHEVYYVDYWPDYHKKAYRLFDYETFKKLSIRSKMGYVKQFLLTYNSRIKRKKNFDQFHQTYIIPYCKIENEQFDVLVYGSDQIWRKQPNGKYNPIYFGENNFMAKRHISFSASMGILPQTDSENTLIRNYLSNFSKIAVRETNLLEYVKSLGYFDAIQTIDPTLLLDYKVWDKIFPPQEFIGQQYILVYYLNGDVFDMKSVEKLAKAKNMSVKILRGNVTEKESDNVITTANPETFVNLIRNSSYVFVSSFHGLAFSLIFRKQVFVSFKSNVERAKSLLNVAGISERYLENHQSFSPNVIDIDYDYVYNNLSIYKQNSLNYLKSITI